MFAKNEMFEILDKITLKEIDDKIRNFRRLNFKQISYEDLEEKICHVVSVKDGDLHKGALLPEIRSYSMGSYLYRVRELDANASMNNFKAGWRQEECWEPPSEKVNIQRLNKMNEPMLYTSPLDPLLAIHETKISNSDRFALIRYKMKSDVNCIMIGDPSFPNDFNSDRQEKLEKLYDFLESEFIRDVGVGTEYLYRHSEIITKVFFDLPPAIQDAWCYRSIADKSKFNLAFRPEKSRDKLCVDCVMICDGFNEKDFSIKLIGALNIASGFIEFELLGGDLHKKYIPTVLIKD